MKPLPYARKKEILEMLKRKDCININQLSQKFNVSYMTIHRDLKDLENEGMVSRVYGGAVVNDSAKTVENGAKTEQIPLENDDFIPLSIPTVSTDLTFEERYAAAQDAKCRMAKEAAAFVQDGEIIALDASTSALQMCPLLHKKNITVITNGLNVALQFSDSETVNVIMMGGFLRKSSLSFGGVHEHGFIKHLNIDKCFFSCSALSFDNGMTELHYEESESKQEFIKRSEKLFVLADHTKLGATAPFVNCNYDQIDTIITDRCETLTNEQHQSLEGFETHGVRVIYAAD